MVKCNKLLGHTWTKWVKFLGNITKSDVREDTIYRQVGIKRRCVNCGYLQEQWLNSCVVYEKDTQE
jgi:hypothetical protein